MQALEAVRNRQRKGLMVLAFVVAGLLFLSWREQMNIRDLREYQHEACLSRATNAARLNGQLTTLAALDEQFIATGDDLAPAVQDVIRQRIEAYRDARLTVPVCD